jgi:hypothetical protein
MKYKVQGFEFTLRPTTVRTRKTLQDLYRQQAQEEVDSLDALDTLEETGEVSDLREPLDEYRWYFDLFCTLTEGPHDMLDFEDFDIKCGERVLSDFLPAATRTLMQQTGFLPLPTAS